MNWKMTPCQNGTFTHLTIELKDWKKTPKSTHSKPTTPQTNPQINPSSLKQFFSLFQNPVRCLQLSFRTNQFHSLPKTLVYHKPGEQPTYCTKSYQRSSEEQNETHLGLFQRTLKTASQVTVPWWVQRGLHGLWLCWPGPGASPLPRNPRAMRQLQATEQQSRISAALCPGYCAVARVRAH